MPHQCVHCKRIIPIASKELLEGCESCKGKFFFYIREEQLEKIRDEPIIEIPEQDRERIEQDVREMAGITDAEAPVILDLESVRAVGSGKFEIDLANLFKKDRPLIYKMEEGKYIIDIASTLGRNAKEIKEIRNPDKSEN